ncbi:MAG TPA: choice-of-anchor Q domain-containing protein [Armatimonadota bacterium]|jgi:hypothetical protein
MGREYSFAWVRHSVIVLALVWTTTAFAAVIRVDRNATGASHDGSSWSTAYLTVADGLKVASAGDEVWVAAGAYNESLAVPKDVALYGGFAGGETLREARNPVANLTVLKGGGWSDGVAAATSVITLPIDATPATVVDGFTITNGGGTRFLLSRTVYHCGRYGYTHAKYEYRGGGILVQGGSPAIRNDVITANSTAHFVPDGRPCSGASMYIAGPGGGIFVARGASPTFSDDVISANNAQNGGGVYADAASMALLRDSISGNTALSAGGGVYNTLSAADAATAPMTLTGCAILNNVAGADGGGALGAGVFTENRFEGNQCGGNGGGLDGGGSLLANSFSGNTAAKSGGGVYGAVDGGINRCLFAANAANDGGAFASGPWTWTVRNSVFHGNTATLSGAAVELSGSGLGVNNTIAGNQSPGGVVTLSSPGAGYDSRVVFVNNVVAANQSGISILSGHCSIRFNDAWNNAEGNYSPALDPGPPDGAISADPAFVGAAKGDLRLSAGSPCIDAGDTSFVPPATTDYGGDARLQGKRVDMGAYETAGAALVPPSDPLHVAANGDDANDGASWGTAKQSVQNALDAAWARGGAEVWVAKGSYYGPFVAMAPVQLFGGFDGSEAVLSARDWKTNPATLDGLQTGSALYANGPQWGPPAAFTLDGFTVRNGLDLARGGGVTCGPVTARIANNLIEDNAGGLGGGIDAASAQGTIAGNVIQNNKAPDAAGPAARYGGGIAASDAIAVIGNTIANNSSDIGGGISGGGSILRNLIMGNSAGTAGGVISSGLIADNLFTRNTAISLGGGAEIDVGARAINNTFVSNTTATDTQGGDAFGGGAVYVYTYPYNAGPTTLVNNVIAFNSTGVSFYMPYLPSGSFTNNDVFSNGDAGWGTLAEPPGNLSVDPLFVSRSASNYRLKAGSPCIDAGDDSVIQLGDLDMDGAPRRSGAHVDIGAYEFAAPNAFTWPDVVRALSIAAGFIPATPADAAHLAVSPGPVSLPDATAIARKAAGLDANP